MQYAISDLIYIVSCLRDPEHGCPWDRKQTPESIINYSLEEVYELADAIESGSAADICGELGDVLFQVVFFSQMAREEGDYTFDDVVNTLCEKLVTRHPHVFVDGTLASFGTRVKADLLCEEAVASQWEKKKQEEREMKNQAGLFDNIPKALPGLQAAAKVQKRAANTGFDWDNVFGALSSLREEIDELEQVLLESNVSDRCDRQTGSEALQKRIDEELGDVLFSCVNVARKLGVDADQSLRRSNRKFQYRVREVLQRIGCDQEGDRKTQRIDSDLLDEYWQIVKSEQIE